MPRFLRLISIGLATPCSSCLPLILKLPISLVLRDSSILHPEGHVTYSIFWRSIMAAKETIEKGLRWIVGNGRKVDIWRDRWLPTPDSFKVISPQRQNWNLEKVAQLIDSETGTWKAGLMVAVVFVENVNLQATYYGIVKSPWMFGRK
nr:hypothetical protein CFP56_75846 [Quercus suber]